MPVDPDQVNWEELLGGVQPNAVRRVHERLVLDAVAAAEGLRLDESEFEHFLAHAAAEQKTSSLALRQRLSENGMMEELRADLLRQQTVRHLLGDLDEDESADDSEEE
jgi:FKBP-type peptidyl-prolyl cis-trans isomerase (trigger factor)